MVVIYCVYLFILKCKTLCNNNNNNNNSGGGSDGDEDDDDNCMVQPSVGIFLINVCIAVLNTANYCNVLHLFLTSVSAGKRFYIAIVFYS